MMENRANKGPGAKTSGRTMSSRLVICIVIIAIGVVSAVYIQKTKPKARKKPPRKSVSLVTAQKVFPKSHQMMVPAMGTVVPAHETLLKSRIAGEVLSVHPEFIEGGFIKKNDALIRIDPKDYQLQVAKSESAVISSEYALKLEMGHQEVAEREWDLIQKDQPMRLQDMELALRKPHLEKAEADLAAAQAELAQAQLNVMRTTIRCPYNAIIRKKLVDIGSQVTAQGALAEIMGVDEYRIQVSLPVEKLKYIDIPKQLSGAGSLVRIRYRNDYTCSGQVIKLLGDLETEGRMARIMVSVKDPLRLSSSDGRLPPLLIGEYVRVEIKGPVLENIYQIPNRALRDNQHVWVAGENNKLEIRKVHVLWRTARSVFLDNGLSPGDQLILSGISVPVSGMELKLQTGTN